ncbi:MAG: ComEC/Rec2 family competence protein, partial [Bacteroidales bacterium]|nr:ComEC/Rec2 family competence protein [Bacteroidales bacterium]
ISFVLIGQLTNRKGFAVNSIAASAFFLLFIRPENLLEIGFQLSYAAVLGIILLQRPIASAVYIKNKYLSKVWDVTAVALAAQLATTPFVLYYFHQFPTYFWLSNLFLVPLSFIIIVCGMGLLLLSFLPLVAGFLGKILSALIYLMNWIIRWIEGLPGSVIQGLYVNAAEFALLLAIVMILVMIVTTKKLRLSFLLLSLGILLFASFAWRCYEQTNSTKLVIYDLKKHSVVDFIHGREHILMTDSITLADDFVKGFHLEGHWVESGLNTNPEYFEPHTESLSMDYLRKRENLISFGGKLFAIWQDDGGCDDSLSYRIQIEWMLVSGRKSEQLEKLLNCYDPALLILDGSVPRYHVKAWKEAALEAGIELYHTSEEGAFVYERQRDFLNRP